MNRRSVLKKILAVPFMTPSLISLAQDRTDLPLHHGENGFINTDPGYEDPSFTEMAPWIIGKLGDFFSKSPRVDIPRTVNDGSVFKENKTYTVTWIGHSTALIQMEGKNILTDPIWSSSAGPFRWGGSPRVSEPGLGFDKLPPIDIVLISHNHYDHLDESTIDDLVDKNPKARFFVPLRVRDWFEDRGITNVEELDWWEGVTYQGLKIICTPAQHFSGRWINDRNQTLWCSWTILGKRKLYFTGDSGYCSHFKNIGRKFGPFDLALIPVGAYAPRALMKPVHMDPDEAVQTFTDLRARKMVAIHWGTFVLTDEPMDEPPKKLFEAVDGHHCTADDFWVMQLGETKEW
jgi:N-acyl-phosphatidylethanolamine-hydrolysing phospholipase D